MKLFFWTAFYLIVWSILPPCTSGKQILKVGGETGWTQFNIFSGQIPDYAAWSSRVTLAPGDDLVFVFFPQLHNIRMFRNHSEYMNCNFTASTLLDEGTSGIYTWTAPAPGTYYFGCSKDYNSHCELGQKLSITVSDQSSSMIHLPPAGSPTAIETQAPVDDVTAGDDGAGNGCTIDGDNGNDNSCSPSASSPPENTILAPLSPHHRPEPSVNPRRVPDFQQRFPPPSLRSSSASRATINAILLLIDVVMAGQ